MKVRIKQELELLFICLLLAIFIIITVSPVSAAATPSVLFDETRLAKTTEGGYETQISETAWYGGSYFAEALRRSGFSVATLSTKPIIYEKLQRYDVLIILSSGDYYSDSEIDAIERFVKNGGGLFLAVELSGDDYFGTNAIAKKFGVSFAKGGWISDATYHYGTGEKYRDTPKISDIKSHKITKGVSSFYLARGTYIKYIGTTNVLAYSDNDAWFDKFRDDWGNNEKESDEISGPFPVLSEMGYGNGGIVFIGDSGLFINDWIDKLDNEKLGINIVKWLANLKTGSKSDFAPKSDLTITDLYTTLSSFPFEKKFTINFKIANIGQKANVNKFYTRLYINEKYEYEWYINPGYLTMGEAGTASYNTSLSGGTYSIKVVADVNNNELESNENNNFKVITIEVSSIPTFVAILIMILAVVGLGTFLYARNKGKKRDIGFETKLKCSNCGSPIYYTGNRCPECGYIIE